MLRRLILIRHGQTQWNSEKRYIGLTDQGLNEKGKSQALGLATALQETNPSAIYSSTLKRARQTASIISRACKIKPKLIAGLDEIDFGAWEGLTLDEIKNGDHSCKIYDWQDLPDDFQMPAGERWSDFQARVKKGFDEILAESSGETAVVITHAGVIKYSLCYLLKISPSNFWSFQIDHGSMTVVKIDKNQATITLLNDTCHLSESNI